MGGKFPVDIPPNSNYIPGISDQFPLSSFAVIAISASFSFLLHDSHISCHPILSPKHPTLRPKSPRNAVSVNPLLAQKNSYRDSITPAPMGPILWAMTKQMTYTMIVLMPTVVVNRNGPFFR
jgi:hypothetical protein